MSEGETTRKMKMSSSIFASELVICGIVMGMGFRDLLSTFQFHRHSVGHYLVGGALIIVTVWYIHLLSVWKIVYEEMDPGKLAWGGLLRLWINIAYVGFLYLAYRFHYNYRWCLTCLTAVIAFDFISSGVGYRCQVDMIRRISRNWLARDVYLVFALAIAWGIHLRFDPASSPVDGTLEPSIYSGLACLGGVVFAYRFDLKRNSEFYGAKADVQTPA